MEKLESLIKKEIKKNGPLTFSRFMELALYHPLLGYYSSGPTIGRDGDFYTAPTSTKIFGAMLARQFHQMWQMSGKPNPWPLVEYGPGTGVLARDVINAIQRDYREFYEAIVYYLIEISPGMRAIQQDLLSRDERTMGKFNWANNLSDLQSHGGISGCIYCNELLDAFPVHLVVSNKGELEEYYVDCTGDTLSLITGPLSIKDLADFFTTQGVELGNGQRAEVNLQARSWLEHVAANLAQGFVLIIDYGFMSDEMYAPQRLKGTLRCFHRHRLVEDPLVNIGEQDITANVNFSAVKSWAGQYGLANAGLVTQPDFLQNIGLLDLLSSYKDYSGNPDASEYIKAIKQFVIPGGMGGIFKVMALSKGLAAQPVLKGFNNRRII